MPYSNGRLRTYAILKDHRHLQGITESPSSIGTPTSPTFRNRDLEIGHTRTIEFRDAEDRPDLRMRRNRTLAIDPDYPVPRRGSQSNLRDMNARTFTRTATLDQAAMHTGFGGFPNPLVAVAGLARQRIPAVRNVFDRNLTMPRTTTMLSTHSHGDDTATGGVVHAATGAVKPVSYISFDAIVGRNSKFHGLTNAQQEELGGVEFRALTVLLRIVVAYWLLMQLIGVLLLAPWLSASSRWRPVIVDEYEVVNTTWFTFFQVWSAFSNLGMRCARPFLSLAGPGGELTHKLLLQHGRRLDDPVPAELLAHHRHEHPHSRRQYGLPHLVRPAPAVLVLPC